MLLGDSVALWYQLVIRSVEQHRPKHSVLLWKCGRQCALGILTGMRIFGVGRCPTVGNFAVLLIPPKPPLPLGEHPLPLRLEVRPVTRPRFLAVLAVLATHLLRLSVDTVEYRQSVG
jgi:hypothetical protein